MPKLPQAGKFIYDEAKLEEQLQGFYEREGMIVRKNNIPGPEPIKMVDEKPDTRFKVMVVGDTSYARPVLEVLAVKGVKFVLKPYKNTRVDYEMLDNVNLAIFTGGEDVNPATYDQPPHPTTHYSSSRDDIEGRVFEALQVRNVPMLGICRGSQFLWAMNGGTLIQNMNNHGRNHNVQNLLNGEVMAVNSTHHQGAYIVTKPDYITILALADPSISTEKSVYDWNESMFRNVASVPEVEAWVNEDARILGIQWHPEMLGCPVTGISLAEAYIDKYLLKDVK